MQHRERVAKLQRIALTLTRIPKLALYGKTPKGFTQYIYRGFPKNEKICDISTPGPADSDEGPLTAKDRDPTGSLREEPYFHPCYTNISPLPNTACSVSTRVE